MYALCYEKVMIYDSLNNLVEYAGVAPEAIDVLQKRLPEFTPDSPAGKSVLIEDKLLVIVQRYATKNVAESKVETHSNFADLQMLLSGNEKIGYAPVDKLEVLTPYQEQGDCALYAVNPEKTVFLPLEPGNFAIFLPQEGHVPGCGDGSEVVKAVVKIHKSLLR